MPADPTPFTFDFIHSQRSAIDALAAETLEEVTRLQAERDAARADALRMADDGDRLHVELVQERARADALQARLDAILGPVEDLDLIAVQAHLRAYDELTASEAWEQGDAEEEARDLERELAADVEPLLREVARLRARLDVLLGPVEGDEEPVNPEEVIALAQVLAHQEAEGVEMYSTTALQAERAVPLAREVVRLRADIKALRQQVAAALADLPENVKRVESDLRAEVDILRRERHAERLRVQERDEEIAELRLTLAADKGRG